MNIVDKILVDPITRGLKFFTKGGVPAYITQVRGRTDGSAVPAGEIGETIEGLTNVHSPVNGTFFNASTLVLNKGRYTIYGNLIMLTPSSVVAWNLRTNPFIRFGISPTSITESEQQTTFVLPGGTGGDNCFLGTIAHTLTVAANNTSYYMVGTVLANPGGAQFTVYGNTRLWAVRIA